MANFELTLSGAPGVDLGLRFQGLKNSLPSHVYDASPSAVGYTAQAITLTISPTVIGETYTAYAEDENLGSQTSMVGEDLSWKCVIRRGYTTFRVESGKEMATAKIVAYNIHLYLAMYAAAYNQGDADRIQAASNAGVLSGEIQEPTALQRKVQRVVHTTIPDESSEAAWRTLAVDILMASAHQCVVESYRLIGQALWGVDPIVWVLGDQNISRVGGWISPIVETGKTVSWPKSHYYLDGIWYTVNAGKYKFPTDGTYWGYLYPDCAGETMDMTFNPSVNYTSLRSVSETFTEEEIARDSDGDITGFPGASYVRTHMSIAELTSVSPCDGDVVNGRIVVLLTGELASVLAPVTIAYRTRTAPLCVGRIVVSGGIIERIDNVPRVGRGLRAFSTQDMTSGYGVLYPVHASDLSVAIKKAVRDILHHLKPSASLGRLYFLGGKSS